MSPLTNTSIIHPDFSTHHQPSVKTAMRSTVDILVPLTDVPPENPFDPQPPGETPVEVAQASVKARIRALSDNSMIAASGQTFDSQGYLIQLPSWAFSGLRVGKGSNAHRLRVKVNPESPDLEGQVMQILAAPHGTEAWARDLFTQVHVNQQQAS